MALPLADVIPEITKEPEPSPLVGKRQYLITYAQCDLEKFPSRESFGLAIAEEFNIGKSAVKVDFWACCMERHKNGGYHYHCCVKLTGSKKWVGVRNRLTLKYGINVHFSDKYDFYMYSYRYVCKTDQEVFHSEEHPKNLLSCMSPKSKNGTQASKQNAKKRREKRALKDDNQNGSLPPKKRPTRLTPLEVSDLIEAENIKSYKQLLAKSKKRRATGQADLSAYVFSHKEADLRNLIKKTWETVTAEDDLQKESLSRMDIIYSFVERLPCSGPCDGAWYDCAKEILDLNGIKLKEFAASLRKVMEEGRGKHKNILIVGPADCGKTFILKPLQIIFKDEVFQNPANNKFSWVNADKARVIFLNDFRFSSEVIQWKDLLLLLEGEPVKLPAPKNLFAEDVVIDSDVPIFATSIGPIRFKAPYGVTNDMEDRMMAVRWKEFHFQHVFPEAVQKKTGTLS